MSARAIVTVVLGSRGVKLETLAPFGIGMVAWLPFGAPLAQEEPILDDPVLYEALIRHEDRQYPAGAPFPDEILTCLFYENAIVDHAVNDVDGEPKILLTSIATNFAGYKLFPNIVHRATAGYWVRTPIPATGDGWTHVHVSQDGRHLLLSMDNVPESAGWETRFVVSGDGGSSWRYGESVRKYVYFDVIRYLSMSETGFGRAIEHYAGGVGGYEQIGYYIFETRDWGMSWSPRMYEEQLDTSGYLDVLPGFRQRRSAKAPLSQVSLPGFDQCPSL